VDEPHAPRQPRARLGGDDGGGSLRTKAPGGS
jgi:hypothetical protein